MEAGSLNSLAIEAQGGNRDAAERLWQAFRPIAAHLARNVTISGQETEDLVSEASVTVLTRLPRFNPAHGTAQDFFTTCVRNRFRSMVKASSRHKRQDANDEPLDEETHHHGALVVGLGPNRSIELGVEANDLLDRFALPIQRDIIARIARGETREEIAAALHMSLPDLRRHIDAFRIKVRSYAEC